METPEKKSKPKSREYPAVTLGTAIAFIEKLKDYPLNKPISYDVAAETCGVKSTTASFKYILSSARQYGLISTSVGKTISFLEPAKRFARPTENEDVLRLLKIECFKKPKLYSELISEYSGQSVPQGQILENILVTQYGILPVVVKGAATTFVKTAVEIGAIQNGILNLAVDIAQPLPDLPTEEIANSEHNTTPPTAAESNMLPEANDEFAAPLNIPFGDKRQAVLYMPIEATRDDALYVKEMVTLMLKRVYGVE